MQLVVLRVYKLPVYSCLTVVASATECNYQMRVERLDSIEPVTKHGVSLSASWLRNDDRLKRDTADTRLIANVDLFIR